MRGLIVVCFMVMMACSLAIVHAQEDQERQVVGELALGILRIVGHGPSGPQKRNAETINAMLGLPDTLRAQKLMAKLGKRNSETINAMLGLPETLRAQKLMAKLGR